MTIEPTAADVAQAREILAKWIMLDRDKLVAKIAQALAAARADGEASAIWREEPP